MLMIKITVWALPHTKWRHYMEIITRNEKILYVGIDVHKDTYSLCCFDFFRNELSDEMTIRATTKAVIKYLEAIKKKNTRKKSCSPADTKQVQQVTVFAADYKRQVMAALLWHRQQCRIRMERSG